MLLHAYIMPVTNDLAYLAVTSVTPRIKFNVVDTRTSVASVIKLLAAVSYEFSKKARAFVPSKPFQSSLMFAGKIKSLS